MATWDFGGEGLSQTELGGKTQDWMLNNIFVPVFVQSGYIEYAVCHPWISILMMFSPFNIMSPLSGFILDLVLMVVDELSVNSGACECIEQVKCECGGENWIGMGKAKVKFEKHRRPQNIPGNYVCISIQSSSQAKYWNYPNGWQTIVDYIKSEFGYSVVCIDKHKRFGNGQTMNELPKGVIDNTGNHPLTERAKISFFFSTSEISKFS